MKLGLSASAMIEKTLNFYGDILFPTTGVHGADVASQRLDDLDKESIREVLSLEHPRVTCVDLGCGFGWHGARLAMLGADVHTFDLLPESTLSIFLRENTRLLLSHRSGDLRHLKLENLPEEVNIAFSQRFIHYLTYEEAQHLIQTIDERCSPAACFYLSASGLNSELGQNYDGSSVEIHDRFSRLSPEMQSKHGIWEPVCLYSESELTELMVSNGFKASKVWKSKFGNIKGVFRKES